MDATRVAVIGLGPRGLTVLERVLEHAHRLPRGTRLQIDVYDDGDAGQGCHRAQQPEHLLINTVASQVTIFPPASLAGGDGGISLVEWAHAAGYRRHGDRFLRNAAERGQPITQGDHLPRAMLGEYLAWAYRRVVDMLPHHVTVAHHRQRVIDLRAKASAYEVCTPDGHTRAAAYVYLTTGHGRRGPNGQDRAFDRFVADHAQRNHHLAYVPSPYPIETLDAIEPGATVAIQGLGLTSHDVVSALTLGRGGRYAHDQGRLCYRPSGREPRMLLFSRNSLPFAARGINQKGLTGRHQARIFTVEAVNLKRQARLAATGDARIDFQADVLPLVLSEMACAYRNAMQPSLCASGDFVATEDERLGIDAILWPLRQRSFSSFQQFHDFVHALIESDLAEAEKGNLSSPIKAATDVLRDTREAMRAAVEHAGLTPASHRFFMEDFNAATNRVSFGPPRQRNAEYLALRRAGLIDIAGGPGASIVGDTRTARFRINAPYPSGDHSVEADVLVVARLDAYSPLTDASSLTDNLLDHGIIRSFCNGDYHPCGIDIDRQMHPIDASGKSGKNIWVLGYPAEGAHFYTHALPRPHVLSRQTLDAQHCVLEMFAAIAERTTAGSG
ncbi:FAD/NAD(P)-binding protein [Pseudorhodoferax soli]|uniref:FAD-NAD(P)-binding protein n=1 Tax=Pseudorhodoferax soli TaxID=545864 RepID=A0A368XNH0_9BURK|nr:FAD/NAD(P)-binding protein [Pseudorhodoferax soli]RCW69530.1 FAD-NAD(P)-binding protein [Pseudorhodoferax soli]